MRGAVAVGVGEAGVGADEVEFGVGVDGGGEVDVVDRHGLLRGLKGWERFGFGFD